MEKHQILLRLICNFDSLSANFDTNIISFLFGLSARSKSKYHKFDELGNKCLLPALLKKISRKAPIGYLTLTSVLEMWNVWPEAKNGYIWKKIYNYGEGDMKSLFLKGHLLEYHCQTRNGLIKMTKDLSQRVNFFPIHTTYSFWFSF